MLNLEPKVREYRRLIINHRIIPKEGDKSFGIKNCGIESDTIGILIINFDENGKPVNQDTIPY